MKTEFSSSQVLLLKTQSIKRRLPYGQSAWQGKHVGILEAPVGAPETSMAQQHLRNILAYLDVSSTPGPKP
jgi:chromate reductase, NAD(P)H dehydrogenase (quinone)